MFFIEGRNKDGKRTMTQIREDNVFTHCAECDTEIPVNLAKLSGNKKFDIFNTGIFCNDCAKRMFASGELKREIPVTIEGIALLSDVLSKAGYGELLSDLYNEFEIDTVNDLSAGQYKPFADALTNMATGESSNDDFAFVPDKARGCMTNEELDETLALMGLPSDLEKAVREVCKNGFVIAPELKRNATNKNGR